MITTIHPGLFTTIQDEGRWGYQAYGMPVAGAMDRYAYRVANLLVGNHDGAAVVEMTMSGASFRFDQEQIVAICGCDMQGKLNGEPIDNWSSFIAPKGCEIKFESAMQGCRAYLAVRGGFDVPVVLESRSTYTHAKIGGCEGRNLHQGDVLYVGHDNGTGVRLGKLEDKYIPSYNKKIDLRVVFGPQDTMFTQQAIDTFLGSSYGITEKVDRMAYRLKGPKVTHIDKAYIVSDALCLGAIQIPAHGMPVIMMADHQTTDGFAKIGSVIRVDLSMLAQAAPGDKIRFLSVTEEEAIEALRNERQCYVEIAKLCKE